MGNLQMAANLGGQFNATVIDNNDAPSSNIDATLPFTVKCDISLEPNLAVLLASGTVWTASAYIESIGGGQEKLIGSRSVAHVNGTKDYLAVIINVPAGTVLKPVAGESGVYKMAVVLTYSAGPNDSRLSAVVEGPFVRIA
jgi:hypothetical protein